MCVVFDDDHVLPTGSIAARDSMAKALYGALFDWIVDKVCLHVLAVV